MGIDLGGFWVVVSQEALDIPQVRAVFQQMGRKAAPKGVYRHRFRDTRLPQRPT